MVHKIKDMKDQLLQGLEQKINERGIDRADMKEIGEITDAVKDLAEAEKACWEAEYYRSVSEAMGSQGYMPEGMGYTDGRGGTTTGMTGGSTRSGYRDSRGRYARRGYSMGYHDEIEGIREAMSTASPEEREKMHRELRQIISM